MYSKGLMINIATELRHLFPNIDLDEKLKKYIYIYICSDISSQNEEAKKEKSTIINLVVEDFSPGT